MIRKAVPTAAALVALLVPATAEADLVGHRVKLTRSTGKHHAQSAQRNRARAAQDGDCAGADLVPAAGNVGAVRDAVLCLHNQVRARNGLPRLREDARLQRAAAGHSADMVERRYFDHTAPGGRGMVSRILGAGYARPNEGWMLGENLAWGTGRLATPRAAMRAWMGSPSHRENILKRGYRELGVGVALAAPIRSGQGATYTVDFGVRR